LAVAQSSNNAGTESLGGFYQTAGAKFAGQFETRNMSQRQLFLLELFELTTALI
jgi:hypothetical protein